MDSQTKRFTIMHKYTQTDLETNRWADIFMDIYSGRSDTKTHTERRRQTDHIIIIISGTCSAPISKRT